MEIADKVCTGTSAHTLKLLMSNLTTTARPLVNQRLELDRISDFQELL